MTTLTRNSLRWVLVRRLIVLQATVLTILVAVVFAALWAGGYLVAPEPEDRTLDAISDAIARDTSGGILIRETPALSNLYAESPDLWFQVRDRSGHVASVGKIPAEFARIGGALDEIGQARLGWTVGDAPRAPARMRWLETPAGAVQILTGSGATLPWQWLATAVVKVLASVILPIGAMMAVTTLLATPIVVRRALDGLRQTAAEAVRIDIDRRATRLSLDQVPQEIAPLVRAVNDALARLDDGVERRQRFLANAAHEVRTPIAILQTRIETLAPGPQTTRLLEDVKRLSVLADQLLDVERLEQTAASHAIVDLVGIARHVTADLAPLAIGAGYEIAFETTVPHAKMLGDEGALQRAIANLIQNAIQYGGRSGRIVVRVTPSSISVTDSGAGIAPADRERVFEPFYRSSAATRGAGLGLNLVREIARLHDGRVVIDDGDEGGACVTISFGQRRPHL
ncbi:MAG: HAMP domain-containing histidine kinase [Tardiphaga sp.]|uniref:sensor histidine kinase n=1 Tax=Tardiphaga sp. TaxID=1926292 RepID=UPI0019B9A68A|nr:HAMP domain-containing sensor histidine kinase [Tardiphaga sp.]MBC7584687.1 HAMP domain-containing histidine kinase [Tardiphaga sp.]